jgi:hypothetical protein
VQAARRDGDHLSLAEVPDSRPQQRCLQPLPGREQHGKSLLGQARRPITCEPAQLRSRIGHLVRGLPGPSDPDMPDLARAADQQVEVTSTGSSRELVGQLIPAQRAGLEIRHGTRADRIAADDLGRFRAESVPAGPVSLYCRLGPGGPGAAVVTDWVSL